MNWIIVMIAITGVVLNIRRKWYCFLFWGVSNLYWLFYNLSIGEYAQAVLFNVFFILCFYGTITWEAKNKDVHKQNLIKSKVINLCTLILANQKSLNRHPGRIKINWLLQDAKELLKLLGDDNNQAVDNKNQ